VTGVIIQAAAIPEPETYALFLAGLAAVASWHVGARAEKQFHAAGKADFGPLFH
jgi:hypothetical protein